VGAGASQSMVVSNILMQKLFFQFHTYCILCQKFWVRILKNLLSSPPPLKTHFQENTAYATGSCPFLTINLIDSPRYKLFPVAFILTTNTCYSLVIFECFFLINFRLPIVYFSFCVSFFGFHCNITCPIYINDFCCVLFLFKSFTAYEVINM